MDKTPNLELPLKLSGHVQMQQSVREAFLKIDTAVGSGGGGAPAPDLSAITPIVTVDATDPASTMALANEIKGTLNALIVALKA